MTNDNTDLNPNTAALANLIEARWATLDKEGWMIKSTAEERLRAAIDIIPSPCDHVGVFDATLDDDAFEALDVEWYEYECEGHEIRDCAIFIAERFLFLTDLLGEGEAYTWDAE